MYCVKYISKSFAYCNSKQTRPVSLVGAGPLRSHNAPLRSCRWNVAR